jgi:ATP-dependent Clp protease ATP-binding subunit ClpC
LFGEVGQELGTKTVDTTTDTISTKSIPDRLKTDVKSDQEISFLQVLDSRIVGQKGAKACAARAKRRAGNPLRNKRGPVYKALLIGKSRTGKTLTAETTALSLHGDASALIRVDCAEYQHGHEVSRLLGAPPSYVGYDAPSDNDEAEKKNPKAGKKPTALLARENLVASRKGSKTPITVILFDEIEKAHTSLKDTLLAIFDKGKIRLANNTETDFTDCIIYLTSNLGMDKLEQFGKSIGFTVREVKEPSEGDVAEVVSKELKGHFRPEFLKRLDEVVIFAPLTQSQIADLVLMELGFVQDRVNEALGTSKRFTIKFDEAVQKHVLTVAEATEGGVAEIKQIIERDIIDALGGELEKNTIAGGDHIDVGVEPGDDGALRLTFSLTRKVEAVEPAAASVADNVPTDGQNKDQAVPVSPKMQALRDLIAAKLVQDEVIEGRQKMQHTIYFGRELGALATKHGGQSSDLESVQRSFMTEEAHRLLWSKTSNAYWFWKIYQGAAKATSSLPIQVSDVHASLTAIRKTVGITQVSPKYNAENDKRVNVIRYMHAGVLLLDKAEGETDYKISYNAIFK